MPVYQYQHHETGRILELIKPVSARDQAPAGYARITVPVRVAIAGTSSSPIDPTSAEATVAKGYRDLEQKMSAREIARESGFTVEKTKRVWGM